MRPVASGWSGIGGVVLLLAASTAAVAAEVPKFDGRGWTVGNQQRNARQSLTEYVLPGQTVETWRELVTSTVFSRPVPISAFLERLRASLSRGCPSLVWSVIRQDEKTAVFEWRDAGCGGFEPQHELDRVAIERDGFYRLAYAARSKESLAPERRKEWLAILDQVPLAERAAGGSPVGRPPAPAPGSETGAPARTLSTEELVAGVRKSGWTCPAGVKSEVKGQLQGPQGLLTTWILECSNGQQYTVLVDPSGGMTAFQTPK
jgi:hypothetical protein